MLLEARAIHKSYGKLQILKGVDLSVERGEIVSIIGASGAGKSTLLHILGTLDKADSGNLTIDGETVSRMSEKKLVTFRNQKIGFIFQFHHLLPEFTALENVCMPAFIMGTTRGKAEKKGLELLELLQVAHRSDHKPGALSGGEQQRVAVARALINNPAIVLADEPSGNLDSDNATALHQLFLRLRSEMDQSFLIVTHNEELAGLSDRVVHMKDGYVV